MRLVKQALPYVVTFLVLWLVMAAIGTTMTPPWLGTKPYTDHITVASADSSTKARGFTGTAEGTYQVKTTTTRVALTKSVSVDAIIRTPIGAPSGRPACLFIHGAGTGKASEVYTDLASSMASAGIATMVPSKRLDTYTMLRRNYYNMAKDYEASLNTLRHLPGVDASKTGIYAESEGTWISEAMALIDPHIAFMVLTSPPAVSGRHQMAMAANSYLALCGAPQGLHGDVDKILSMDFAPLGPNYADFPAEQYLGHLTMPLLVNYGTDDPSMPIEQGVRLIKSATGKAGNANTTFRYYHANHQMRVGAKTSKPGLPLDSQYTKNLDSWVEAATLNPATATTSSYAGWDSPQIAGAQPNQRFLAPNHTASGIVGSLNMVVGAIAAMMICFMLAALLALVVKCTTHHATMLKAKGKTTKAQQLAASNGSNATLQPSRIRQLPHRLAVLLFTCPVALLTTVIVFFAYVAIALTGALSLTANPSVLKYGWLLMRILTLADTALCTGLAVNLVKKPYHQQAQARQSTAQYNQSDSWGLLRGAIIVAVTVGSILTLLLLAFFGMYEL